MGHKCQNQGKRSSESVPAWTVLIPLFKCELMAEKPEQQVGPTYPAPYPDHGCGERVPLEPEALRVGLTVWMWRAQMRTVRHKGSPEEPHLRGGVSALSSEMFLLPLCLSNLMFYLDPGLDFILHVDNFLVPVASFSLLLLLKPVLSEPQDLPSPSLSGVGMCKRAPPKTSFHRVWYLYLILPHLLPPWPWIFLSCISFKFLFIFPSFKRLWT